MKNRKLLPQECNLGTLKRNVHSVSIDPDDQMIYCGTTTGDILKINFETKLLVAYGPKKTRFSLGAETVAYSKGQVYNIISFVKINSTINYVMKTT